MTVDASAPHLAFLESFGPPRSVPDPTEVCEVRLVGCERGCCKVSSTLAIRHFSGLGLADSKHRFDRTLAGETVSVQIASRDAETFRSLMRSLGTRVDG
jgi:hypothetical protein